MLREVNIWVRRASIFSVTLQRASWEPSVHGSSANGASGGGGDGGGGEGGGGDGGGGEGGGGESEGGGDEGGIPTTAKRTCNHCNGHALPRVDKRDSEIGLRTVCE